MQDDMALTGVRARDHETKRPHFFLLVRVMSFGKILRFWARSSLCRQCSARSNVFVYKKKKRRRHEDILENVLPFCIELNRCENCIEFTDYLFHVKHRTNKFTVRHSASQTNQGVQQLNQRPTLGP